MGKVEAGTDIFTKHLSDYHYKDASYTMEPASLAYLVWLSFKELRWPGYPQKPHFAMFHNLPRGKTFSTCHFGWPLPYFQLARSIVLEAGFGTGRARLEVISGQEILEARMGLDMPW